MAKITLIGAGSIVFAKNLIGDILLDPALAGSEIHLMDIDGQRLQTAKKLADRMTLQTGSDVKISAGTDRRAALKGADYVITVIQAGGLKAYELDLAIPVKYGIDQAVGDTLGPGGVFRALRTIPVMLDIARDMEELCPGALLMNYVNPMAMITWAVYEATGISTVGLCHSVQGTSMDIASYIGAPYGEVTYKAAGINHMAWFLEYKWNGKDAYPLLFKAMEDPLIYNRDLTKFEVLKYFGSFVTESSYHLSEYLPYFRKSPEIIARIGEIDSWLKKWHGRCFDFASDRQEDFYQKVERQIGGVEQVDMESSHEYGSRIIHAMQTGEVYRINGNVRNTGLITNLPNGCCVEVPCLVDRNGIAPCHVGDLPAQLAALNRTNINVQELAVQSALKGDVDAALHAVLLDPLTSALLTCGEIKAMAMELFAAERDYLPQFKL